MVQLELVTWHQYLFNLDHLLYSSMNLYSFLYMCPSYFLGLLTILLVFCFEPAFSSITCSDYI
jgi:hypothetical protein